MGICARQRYIRRSDAISNTSVRAALEESAAAVALVRIRSGDFVYTEEELRDMVAKCKHRVAAAVSHWAASGPTGVLTSRDVDAHEAAGGFICSSPRVDEV